MLKIKRCKSFHFSDHFVYKSDFVSFYYDFLFNFKILIVQIMDITNLLKSLYF